jgi:hypothetical protein
VTAKILHTSKKSPCFLRETGALCIRIIFS